MGSFIVALRLSCRMWELSSPTRDQTRVSCIAGQIPDHWITRVVPSAPFIEVTILSILTGVGTLVKDCLTIYVRVYI